MKKAKKLGIGSVVYAILPVDVHADSSVANTYYYRVVKATIVDRATYAPSKKEQTFELCTTGDSAQKLTDRFVGTYRITFFKSRSKAVKMAATRNTRILSELRRMRSSLDSSIKALEVTISEGGES